MNAEYVIRVAACMCVEWPVVSENSFSKSLIGFGEGYTWSALRLNLCAKFVCVLGSCIPIATSLFLHFNSYGAILQVKLYVTKSKDNGGCSHSFDNWMVQYIVTLVFKLS